MASQGPNNPATATTTGVGVAWTNTSNIFTEDGTFAQSIPTNSSDSQLLSATNFGFSIPETAQITGFIVEYKRKVGIITAGYQCADSQAVLLGGTGAGSDKLTYTAFPTSFAYQLYGSSTDTWGQTWTPAQVNASTFGFGFRATIQDGGTGGGPPYTGRAQVDHIRITVYYVLNGSSFYATNIWFGI